MRKYTNLLVILVVVMAIVGGGWYVTNRLVQPEEPGLVGDNMEVGDEVRERFGDTEMGLSSTSEKINLKPVGEYTASGMSTREMVGDVFLHTILADLPEPVAGKFYEGWLVRESDTDVIYTGKLEVKKGGWVLEYVGRKDLSDHALVVVTLETRDDQKPEVHVLEGGFE